MEFTEFLLLSYLNSPFLIAAMTAAMTTSRCYWFCLKMDATSGIPDRRGEEAFNFVIVAAMEIDAGNC
ncbi:uncharacterized protein DS421_20g695450 [Arachis hypogaea]|nr:uncharacterized protein DS421_20g695450 [Arachis hypogaea]